MSQAGPVSQSRAPGSAAVTITVLRIIETGDDYEISDTGTEAAILVASGDDLEFGATSGTQAATLAEIGDNIRTVEI